MPKNNLRLFLISLAMLFLEVLLIRWISTEVRIFAYLGNLVLLACFLGIGVGCYFSRRKAYVLLTFGMLLLIALSVRFGPFKNITDLLSGFSDSVIWYQSFRSRNFLPALEGALLTLLMFLMILIAFFPLGQILGRLLDEHPAIIEGYSVNVLASLIGIWIFSLFCLYFTKPGWWFVFALLILFVFLPRSVVPWLVAGAVSLLVLLNVGLFKDDPLTIWSPYQKLDVAPNEFMGAKNGFVVNVNNVGFMSLLDLSDQATKGLSQGATPWLRKFSPYDLPYAFAKNRESVLIVGAGGGNDAAGALRNGARVIDAVEIDPGIIFLGEALHPEHPYQKGSVHIHIDDARSFFKKTGKKYDLIIFGLLDSHTISSNYNNTRLDHYVYTDESFREARNLLKDDGVLSVNFATQTEWIGERIHGLLKKNFGEVPYIFPVQIPGKKYVWGGTMFLTGKNITSLQERVEADPELKAFLNSNKMTIKRSVRLTTDDWPYLYIEKASIPRMYLLIMVLLLLLFLTARKFIFRAEGGKINLHFFFLGCAFLLLEFQNVSKASLLFGSTWIVNAYIFSSILLLILLANGVAARIKVRSTLPLYGMLWASLIILYLTPLDIFNGFGFWTKSLLATLFLNLPVFFAGIIYIQSFKNSPAKDLAFGSNLIGAAFGGLLESLSFLTGIKALLLLVLGLYLLSYLFWAKGTAKT
jgi:spermidine synthase